MKYTNIREDMRAISQLLESGQIELEEARQMREYLEELSA